MSLNRTLANLGKAIDSASTGTFLSKDDATDADFISVAYSDVSGTPSSIDSSALTTLIDSAYIQLRQTAVSSSGLDSAAVQALVDSDYVSARTSTVYSGFEMYDYVATAGQTTFQDSDANGNVLSFDNGGILVFYNGILMRRGTSHDYIEGTNVVTLNTAADSAANITISKWKASGGSIDGTGVWYGDRAVWSGGDYPEKNIMDYVSIATSANATDFGDLQVAVYYACGAGDGTYGLTFGGSGVNNGGPHNNIQYVTIATTGNASDFGDCLFRNTATGAWGDGLKAGIAGGYNADATSKSNVIQYVMVATPANSTDFGDLTAQKQGGDIVNDATYGVYGGGNDGSRTNVMEYWTMATLGNASDYGDLTAVREDHGGVGNVTYGIFAGGHTTTNYVNSMDYITIATTGNASNLGSLATGRSKAGATTDNTYAIFGGGYTGSSSNVIDRLTISTSANASDFGDLTNSRSGPAAYSGSSS